MSFSPDGQVIASGALDGVRLWDITNGRVKTKLDAGKVLAVDHAPDGSALATGGDDNASVIIWDLATGKIRSRLSGLPEDDAVISLAFSPDRRSLAAATTDKETVFSLDGKVIRSGNGSTISSWEFTNGRELLLKRRITRIIGVVWALAFSPDGTTLAAATEAREIRLWDLQTGKERASLRGHRKTVHGVAFSFDGKLLASGSLDKTVKLWDLSKGEELATFRGHTSAVKCVAFAPDGRTIASGSWDNTARLWDAAARPGPPAPRPHVALKQPATAERVVAEIRKLGGRVERADRGSSVPRTLVDLRETDLGDAELAELHIAKIDDIWYLNLSDTRVTNDGLAGIKGLSHLQALDLSGTEITDAGLVHIKEMNALTSLTLPKGVTDAGLARLQGLRALRTLNLAGTEVTNDGLMSLNGLKSLRTLILSSQVPESALARLRKALPGVRVLQ